ncbi:MAG: hypothetical protein ACRENQ_14025 [Gemmatimonadaceae bacterium]
MATHRPLGLTILSLAFLGLTVGVFDYAERVVSVPSQVVPAGFGPRHAMTLAVVCGILSASVAIGAWVSGRWLPGAIVCWGVVVGVTMFEVQRKLGGQAEPMWLVLLPYVLVLMLTWVLAVFGARRV